MLERARHGIEFFGLSEHASTHYDRVRARAAWNVSRHSWRS